LSEGQISLKKALAIASAFFWARSTKMQFNKMKICKANQPYFNYSFFISEATSFFIIHSKSA